MVGGGASGALVAVNLLRTAGPAGVEVLLMDRRGDFGPGIAYGTTNPDHRLNVAAARMGALDGEPGHFLDWLQLSGNGAALDQFAPRGVYGEYLRHLLQEAEADAIDGAARLRKLRVDVGSVAVSPKGVTVSGPGEDFECDHVVLAVGPLPSGDPFPIPEELRENGTYIPNAWDERDIDRARGDDSVLIIGSGLTMVDAAISLTSDRETNTMVRTISRNGMVPVAHRSDYVSIDPPVLPAGSEELSLAYATGLFLDAKRRAESAGGDWRDAMDSMRPVTPELWRRMPLADRRWFLRNLQRVWETHRFRMAPEIAIRFEELVLSGRVAVSSGRISRIEPATDGARVSLATPDGQVVLDVDHIINSTGASGNILSTASPLLRGLIDSGAVRPDELLLGLDVAPSGRAIEMNGAESDRISLIGSIRRGAEWESIGITEIRVQAAAIARDLMAPSRRQ